jgi:hypothetical protein
MLHPATEAAINTALRDRSTISDPASAPHRPVLADVRALLKSVVDSGRAQGVISVLATPPGSPVIGDRHLVAASGLSGVFVGNANRVAEWTGTAWLFGQPEVGDRCFVAAATLDLVWTGTVWAPPATPAPSFATRAALEGAAVDAGISVITLSERSTGAGGGGVYVRLGAAPSPVKAWHVQAGDASWWELRALPARPRQFAAVLDGAADDTTAMQAWLDYAAALQVPLEGEFGTALIPTATLAIAGDRLVLDGRNLLEIRRGTDAKLPLFSAVNRDRVTIERVKFTTAAGMASTTSNSVGTGAKTFAVPAGRSFTSGQQVILIADAAPQNYMIASVTSYSGASFAVNVTAAVGAGTFTAWTIGHNDGEASALSLRGCTDAVVRGNRIEGLFYVAAELRNCDGLTVEGNDVRGALNRNVYVYATSGTVDDVNVNNNFVSGLRGGVAFSQYGINFNGSTGGSIRNFNVDGNKVENCVFQGIEAGGAVNDGSIDGNKVEGITAPAACGILIQEANGSQPQRVTALNNTVTNMTGAGAFAILLRDVLYCEASHNKGAALVNGVVILQSSGAFGAQFNRANDNSFSSVSGDGVAVTAAAAGGCAGTQTNGNTIVGTGGASVGLRWNALAAPGSMAIGNQSVAAGTAYVKGAALAVDQHNI